MLSWTARRAQWWLAGGTGWRWRGAHLVGDPAPALGRGPLRLARRRGVRARAPQLWRLALDAAGRPNGPWRECARDRRARDDSGTRRRWDAVARAGLSASAPRLLADVAHAVLPPARHLLRHRRRTRADAHRSRRRASRRGMVHGGAAARRLFGCARRRDRERVVGLTHRGTRRKAVLEGQDATHPPRGCGAQCRVSTSAAEPVRRSAADNSPLP